MNTGFGTNLEGFIIEGNLSLNKAPLPGIDGDGSLEASGTIYIDTIREYSQTGGVTIQDVVFQNQTITVPYTQPSISLTTASLLIDGGIYIRNTTNSTSLTSGGGITVLGGASFNKDVHIGGITNVYDNRIINVQWPILGGDAANKDYVDSKTFGSSVTGNFTQGQVLIGGTGGNIEGYDSFLFNGQNLTLTTPLIINNTTPGVNDTSGALIVYGGGYFGNYTTINNVLNMNNNYIQNVLDPVLDQDAATKKYVDDNSISGNFTRGQVIVADSNGDAIRGYDNIFLDIPDGTNGSLLLNQNTILTLANSTAAIGLGSGGTLNISGGVSILGKTYLGDELDVNLKNIKNVLDPVLDQDAATKKYVDDYGINDNFTKGQLIIGDSDGNDIRGYDNLFFDIPDGTTGTVIFNQSTSLTLDNSTGSIGLGSGGTLNISGGVSILGKTYLGDELDMGLKNIRNLQDPEVDYDAVNKKYVDDLFKDVDYTQISNNILIPVDIPDFTFSNDIRAFIAYIYVQYNHVDCSRVTVRGINRGTSWYIQKTFVGEPTNIDFYITNSGNMQYTNSNSSGISSIRFKTLTLIHNDPIADQINFTLDNNILTYTDIPELTFLNSEYDSAKVILYVSNDTSNNYGLVFLNCLLKNNQWIINQYAFGNISGINFSIDNLVNSGVISYINTNLTGTWDIRCEVIKILKTDTQLTLLNNTVNYTSIPELTFENSQYVFLLTAFVSIPDNNQYALYEIEGLNCNGEWHINTRFIGDLLDIHFNITTVDNIGYLQYINGTSYNAYIKSVLNTPMAFDSLPVNRGGIGTNYLQPHTILRGNGIDPIIGTNDFIYKDFVLELGNGSSILLNNITNSSGYTSGGVFTNLGGGCFSKDLYVGQNLFIQSGININGIDITPSVGDLTKEQLFSGNHNVIDQSIIGLFFNDPTIKSFNGTLCITVTTSTPSQLDALYTIKTLKKSSGWIIDYSFIGDSLGITLDIDNSGQITYSSPSFINWLSTEIHFRGLTTTI